MIKLSEKGRETQQRLLDNFKSQMQEIANEIVNEAYEVATFNIESEDYTVLKDRIIQELKGGWVELHFFTKQELNEVLLSIGHNKRDYIEKSIIDNYEQRIKDLKKELDGYHPF